MTVIIVFVMMMVVIIDAGDGHDNDDVGYDHEDGDAYGDDDHDDVQW